WRTKRILNTIFWILPIIVISAILFLLLFRETSDPAYSMIYVHSFSGFFLLVYIPKLVFILFNIIDDIWHSAKLATLKIKNRKTVKSDGKKITRNQFITRAGVITAGLPFLSLMYGIVWGRFNFIIRKSKISFKNLPKSFDGFKIVQISDFHIGSFLTHQEKVKEVVDLINLQNPDIILFTGDFVNNVSEEVDKFMPILSQLKARFGVYSILGNHDYGEYVPWNSQEEKDSNLKRLIELQKQIGFNVLLNANESIKIRDEFITLIGVENWGLPPFPQYGDLNKALENVDRDSFKILMSHDPTHWDAQVVGKTNIDLTLSGHTHGAQFGVEIPGWRWSPVDLRYKQWGGIYKNGKQALNVNTGIGFIGFPGRIGMPPEIGLITLKRV
ncbi:MAG: metallophosphoesterase, partial [Melioribacteraceae bacterium]|nr:metallophosphoesterase [Melioribacteraceae bacterium]